MVDTYKDMYGKEPEIVTVHAGLECGLFLNKRPELDCVSIGSDLRDVHPLRRVLTLLPLSVYGTISKSL